jgi:DNA-binding XRE family transcriptional regulator
MRNDEERLNLAINFFVDNLAVSALETWVKADLADHCKKYPRAAQQMIMEYAHTIGFPLTEAQKKKKRLGLPFAEWRETFGPKMRGYRHKFRMNQADFAFVVGTTRGQVSCYECGVRPVPMELQIKVERAVELWEMSAAAIDPRTEAL